MADDSHLRRFNRLIGEINAVYHDIASHFGLSDSAFQIIYTLYVEDGSCQLRDICSFSGLTKQTVNSALRNLERDEIVTGEKSGSKQKIISLTAHGADLAEHTAARIIAAENEIFGSWTDDELKNYLHLTEEYLIAMRKSAGGL